MPFFLSSSISHLNDGMRSSKLTRLFETGFHEQFNGTIAAKENENQVADGSFLVLMTMKLFLEL